MLFKLKTVKSTYPFAEENSSMKRYVQKEDIFGVNMMLIWQSVMVGQIE